MNTTQQNPKLWELSDEITELENLIADIQDSEDLSDSEKESRIEYTFQQWLESGGKFEDKALKVAAWIKHQETLAEGRNKEYKRLKTLSEQAQKQADRMRGYLVHEMTKLGKPKIEGITAKLFLRKKPPRVCLNCEPEQLPPEFKRVTVEPRLTAIKDYLKTHTCEFATLSTQEEYSVIIK